MTKILHVPFCYYPDAVGGTEVYVAALTRQLRKDNFEVIVAAPGEKDEEYLHEGTPVKRFKLSEVLDPRDLYGEGDQHGAQSFGRVLDAERPRLVHLHGFTRGVSLLLAREAKRRGIPVILNYHVATVSCTQGSLMRWGTERCDGKVELDLCTRCTLHGRGMPRKLADIFGRVPVPIGRGLGLTRQSGKLITALRMREFVNLRQHTMRSLMSEVEHIVAVCDWVKSILLLNGIPSEKVSVSRYGLPQDLDETVIKGAVLPAEQRPLRVVFLGRIDPIKGPDLLIKVLRELSDAPIKLDLIGVVQDAAGNAYHQELRALAAGDSRISFLPGVPNQQVPATLKQYHLMAIPSRVQDVSPIVMLEANAVGVPIVASAVGGIPELIKHEVNGLLVKPDSVDAWREALQRFIVEPWLLAKLRGGVSAPRGMKVAVEEIIKIYQNVIGRTCAAA